MEHGARNDIPATATAIEGRGRDGPGRGGAGRRALMKAVDLPETPGFEDGGTVPLRARAANVLPVKPSRHRGSMAGACAAPAGPSSSRHRAGLGRRLPPTRPAMLT